MTNSKHLRQLEIEKSVYLYSVALERGDFETVTSILNKAETDAELEQAILESNEAYVAELEQTQEVEATALVRRLIAEHLPSAVPVEDEELRPITVGDVAARIQADLAQRSATKKDLLVVTRQLQSNSTPLPPKLGLPDVVRLLKQAGVAANQHFAKLFRETAIMLSMGRQQGLMAATRRQKKTEQSAPPEDK
jgi:hypothetical protein